MRSWRLWIDLSFLLPLKCCEILELTVQRTFCLSGPVGSAARIHYRHGSIPPFFTYKLYSLTTYNCQTDKILDISATLCILSYNIRMHLSLKWGPALNQNNLKRPTWENIFLLYTFNIDIKSAELQHFSFNLQPGSFMIKWWSGHRIVQSWSSLSCRITSHSILKIAILFLLEYLLDSHNSSTFTVN